MIYVCLHSLIVLVFLLLSKHCPELHELEGKCVTSLSIHWSNKNI